MNANFSHNYREKFELFKFRDINNYHHAHDAYLAAVLGEYKEKYFRKHINYDLIKELNSILKENKDYKNLRFGYVVNSLNTKMNSILNDIVETKVDEEIGEVLFNADEFNKKVENTLYRNDILISRKTEIRTGKFYKETILPHNHVKVNSGIRLHDTLPVDKYGFYTELKFTYLALVSNTHKCYVIGVPLMLDSTEKINNYLASRIKCNINDLKIIKTIIPFNTLIKYNGQEVYLTGNGELMNAYEIKINKENMKKWKYTLNLILNNKSIPKYDNKPIIADDEVDLQMNDIIEFLLSLECKIPLYKSSINKVKNINITFLDFDTKKKLVLELFKMLSSSKNNADLKFIGGTEREGRLTFSNINNGVITFKSTTGLKESKYEF